ncbi:MAG: abortive infection family protein [Acidimicrobiales bacterium]
MQAIIRAAIKRSARAHELVDNLLATVRLNGCFGSKDDADERRLVTTAQSAFRRAGWVLSDDGTLMAIGAIDLDTGGRQALDEQLDRLRRSAEDPGQLLGSAKDLLEAVAKFVFEELGCPPVSDFNQLWYLARDRLGVHPRQFVEDAPGAEQVRKILGASWTIAEQVNELRNLQGTGHGRTLPTGVPPDVALLVAREACSLAQFSSVPSTEFWDAQPEKRRARPLRPPTGPHRSHV